MSSPIAPEKNHEAVVQHYATLAPEYDRRWDRYTRVSLTTLIEHLNLTGDEHLLDVACGTGRLGQMIREQYPDVHLSGTDLSPDMIRVAESRLPADEKTNWQISPAESLPFEDTQFDVVTCANAFHLVPDQPAALREFRRVLKPGGRLAIVDWCRTYVTVKGVLVVSRLFGRQYRQIHKPDELARLMTEADFEVADSHRFKATWFWGLMCLIGSKAAAPADMP